MSERKKKQDSTPEKHIIVAVDRMACLPEREVDRLVEVLIAHRKKVTRSKKATREFLAQLGL